METQNWRTYKETEARRKLVDKRLETGIGIEESGLKGESGLKKKQKIKELFEKYRVKKKGLKTAIEELKQRMLAKIAKVKNMSKELNNLDRTGFLTSTRRRSTQN